MRAVVDRYAGVVAPSRARRLVLLAIVVGLSVLALTIADRSGDANLRVVHGWAQPRTNGAAIGLFTSPAADEGEAYIIAGARWVDASGTWHEGAVGPSCVGTDIHSFTEVELGVVDVKGPSSRWPHVVWLRCL